MRVISLAPSLTESLLECGVEVVGRTRFCIHPQAQVSEIPSVGGTKEVDWEACRKLSPDIVVLDKEENTLEMARRCPLPWTAVHITSTETAGEELGRLARELESDALGRLADDWIRLAEADDLAFAGWDRVPGTLAYLGQPTETIARVEYLIWKKPWMGIGPGTFIHSMLRTVGLGDYLQPHASRYVELPDATLGRSDTFYLFSSEPYPFARYEDELRATGLAGAIVDGESYSWYGVRSLRFLRQLESA